MARGFASGLIWGTLVSLGGAAVVSLNMPLPNPPDLVSSAPAAATPAPAEAPAKAPAEAPAQAPAETDDAARSETPAQIPAQTPAQQPAQQPAPAETRPEAPAATAEAPAPDTLAGAAATDPAAQPQVGQASGLTQPAAPTGASPAIGAAPRELTAPQTPAAQSAPGAAPRSEAPASISTEPAQPRPPAVTDSGSGFGTGQTADRTAEPAPERAPEAAAEPAPEPATEPAPESQPAPQTTTQAQPEPETRPAPQIAALPQAGTDDAAQPGVTVGTPVVPLTERNAGTSSRLPTVTAPATDPATDAAVATPAPAAPAATRPIERFAAPFEAPGDLPLMAIVLIDDDASIGVEALADFPYPLTFAIDPTAPDAAEKMARHRAAGFEVLALVNLTPTATPRDAEAALELGFSTLDQAVGLIEGSDDGIQGNRPLSDQVTAILRDKGYGMVTQNVGLNTVAKLAQRAGVPAAPVFRDFDGAGQTPTVMRRFLDQAAFRAGQEGSVIMLGRVRPDTVSALLLWGLQDRAERVALAPVSAVLLETPPAD